jgi:TatA/E family protein of Tat protein translocase
MFGPLGVPELILIFAVILIVFGPRRLPEIGKTLGKAMGEFRKATEELKGTIEREVRLEELKQIKPSLADLAAPIEAVPRKATIETTAASSDPQAPPSPAVEPLAEASAPTAPSIAPEAPSASEGTQADASTSAPGDTPASSPAAEQTEHSPIAPATS